MFDAEEMAILNTFEKNELLQSADTDCHSFCVGTCIHIPTRRVGTRGDSIGSLRVK
jgi:hypothetical protein